MDTTVPVQTDVALPVKPSDHVFSLKTPCPYCGGRITFRATGWVQEDDGSWSAESGDMECSSEPDIATAEWHNWVAVHGDNDFGDAWHRLHDGIIAVLHDKVRFKLDEEG